ncbi:tRNA (5-methylaminomethyl-2-thiouridine)(34)-methyltransferase MnmD [Synechococcus sp. MU1611]|uniref:tRNA (5-methylaminomethyl-2-thiouridine)(34)-methyltransferase MnmD n=1 Tax=Synechococcus sp. MU1611 TaxID=2508345 RepID=UPI001CF86A31|nr:MnmC family methyltransferase [Synechococcus sp. MU1611]MCB4411075.1 SAM-dependent methyltransferase [Synechococcus sp. MU1611]
MSGSAADLGALRVYPTADGSFSLHSDHFGEAFHNSAGALNEARAKFVQPAELQRFRNGHALKILDVCLGLGYNTAAVLEALLTAEPVVRWWGLELDRRPLEQALDQTSFHSLWPAPVLAKLEAIRDQGGWQENNSRGIQLWGDARATLQEIPEPVRFDLVLLDAFSPQRCPELWSEEFLGALARRLEPQGRLLTYSRSAAVRASLKRAGLRLFSLLPAPGERAGWSSGTLATPPDSACPQDGPGWRPLSAMEWEHLQTRAAVPFRDPQGNATADAILQRRREEQQHCGYEPTNAWQRRWRRDSAS